VAAWSISFEPKAEKDLQRLSSVDRGRILRYLSERIAPLDDPRMLGKALTANFAGAWRYRVGDIRIIVRLEFDTLVVVVIAIGQRGDIYR
jgi:mRNA interferase RelE/StbE